MKFVISYLKDNLKWILTFFICGLIMASVMVFHGDPIWEILYAAGVSSFLMVAVFCAEGISQWRHYRALRQLEQSAAVSLEHMAPAENIVEKEYQKLLRLSFEERIRKENEAFRQQKDMREYYAMWVHQIKTPIFALKLLLEQNQEHGSRNEELEELLHIEQYVEMALQYVRLESETTDFVIGRVGLDGLIRSSIRKYARLFIHKKINLEYAGTEAVVLTDEKWLLFVIEQILSNAVKYTAKGKITISLEQEKPLSAEGERELYLVIADTGIGIRAEDLPRICEKGYTGYNGHSDKRSTGIGLYLCSRILHQLGHSLTIDSEEGAGTRVRIGFHETGRGEKGQENTE